MNIRNVPADDEGRRVVHVTFAMSAPTTGQSKHHHTTPGRVDDLTIVVAVREECIGSELSYL